MQSLIVTFIAKPGCEPALTAEIHELQRSTSLEPGSICYEFHRGAEGSRTFYLYERYADAEALKTHMTSTYLQAAMPKILPLLTQPPTMIECERLSGLLPRRLEIDGKLLTVHSIPLGPANLVFAQTERGILACGAIDPGALNKFGLPAARVKPVRGPFIANLDDLLAGEVREANEAATALGVTPGMTGRAVLALF